MRTRNWRRAQKFRMRARAEKIMRDWGIFGQPYPAKEFARYMADNMKVCSNYCCGNPRKHFGELTIQERKQKGRLE